MSDSLANIQEKSSKSYRILKNSSTPLSQKNPLPAHVARITKGLQRSDPLSFVRKSKKNKHIEQDDMSDSKEDNDRYSYDEQTTPNNDVIAAILYLKKIQQSGVSQALIKFSRFPKLVLVHQIYSILKDRTTVDRQLEFLVQQRKILKFRIGSRLNEYSVCLFEDYCSEIEILKRNAAQGALSKGESSVAEEVERMDLLDRFVNFLESDKSSSTVFFSLQALQTGLLATEENVSMLMNYGLLTLRDENSFWLGYPGAGRFIGNISKGSSEILRILRKRKYKEILESQLELKRLRESIFSHSFHLADLEGAYLIDTFSTPSGTGIRLRTTR